MASIFSQKTNKPLKFHSYENTKFAINECLKQFSEFTNAINEVCNQASVFGRSLQSLEEMSAPEIIGSQQVQLIPLNKFKNTPLLLDSLDTFCKWASINHLTDFFFTDSAAVFHRIMLSFSEKIKNEAIDKFDNFIVQAVAPSGDEVKGILEHNRSVFAAAVTTLVNLTFNCSQIIYEFRESFFSLYNHFLVLAAELMEKFLLCGNCCVPIGFPHQPLCLTESMSNLWKKTKFDDKFITFGMNFCFDDLITPGCRKNLLTMISNACWKQSMRQRSPKPSLPLMTKSWPKRWLRGDRKGDRSK